MDVHAGIYLYIYIYLSIYIYIKKNDCLFFMHRSSVIAYIIKLSMAYIMAQRQTEMDLHDRTVEDWVKFHPALLD